MADFLFCLCLLAGLAPACPDQGRRRRPTIAPAPRSPSASRRPPPRASAAGRPRPRCRGRAPPARPRAARNADRAAGARSRARTGPAGETIGELHRAPENLGPPPQRRREKPDRRREPWRVGAAGVAGVHRRGDEHPLGVIDADERKLQEPAEALLGPQIDRVAPGDVGERANRDAQPPFARRLAGKRSAVHAASAGAKSGTRANGRPTSCAPSTRGSDAAGPPRAANRGGPRAGPAPGRSPDPARAASAPGRASAPRREAFASAAPSRPACRSASPPVGARSTWRRRG